MQLRRRQHTPHDEIAIYFRTKPEDIRILSNIADGYSHRKHRVLKARGNLKEAGISAKFIPQITEFVKTHEFQRGMAMEM
jgi:hypothetical protein